MGTPSPMIVHVETPEYGRVILEASDGLRYFADLSSFKEVYCYPRDEAAWKQVGIDAYGLDLIWTSRFEVHVDQVIGLADRREAASSRLAV